MKRDYWKVPARPVCTGAEQGGVCGWEAMEPASGFSCTKIRLTYYWNRYIKKYPANFQTIVGKIGEK
ncbi:MAG: hypothetical protein OEW23_19800 [Candidatus Aminicenantes bacterium]|nr:hypothetical protein [Candidatus Aminicenantes bacterium]